MANDVKTQDGPVSGAPDVQRVVLFVQHFHVVVPALHAGDAQFVLAAGDKHIRPVERVALGVHLDGVPLLGADEPLLDLERLEVHHNGAVIVAGGDREGHVGQRVDIIVREHQRNGQGFFSILVIVLDCNGILGACCKDEQRSKHQKLW